MCSKNIAIEIQNEFVHVMKHFPTRIRSNLLSQNVPQPIIYSIIRHKIPWATRFACSKTILYPFLNGNNWNFLQIISAFVFLAPGKIQENSRWHVSCIADKQPQLMYRNVCTNVQTFRQSKHSYRINHCQWASFFDSHFDGMAVSGGQKPFHQQPEEMWTLVVCDLKPHMHHAFSFGTFHLVLKTRQMGKY